MQHVREVERTADVSARHEPVVDLAAAPADLDDIALTDVGSETSDATAGSWSFAEMVNATDTDGILVLRDGRVLCERYFGGLRIWTPHLWHSITKSLASCVVANPAERGPLDPERAIGDYVAELDGSAHEGATVRHLLDMTVGVRCVEDHEDFDTEDSRLDRFCGLKPRRAPDEPGSVYDHATTTTPEGGHDRMLRCVSLNTDVLGWVVERATGVAMPESIRQEVWMYLGNEHEACIALDGAGSAQLDGGFCSSLGDLGRFERMLAQDGRWNGRQVVPQWWLDEVRHSGDKTAFAASEDPDMLPGGSYRSCFWVAEPAGRVTLLGIGMYGQMLYVDADAGVIVAMFSGQPHAGLAEPITRTFLALESLARALT